MYKFTRLAYDNNVEALHVIGRAGIKLDLSLMRRYGDYNVGRSKRLEVLASFSSPSTSSAIHMATAPSLHGPESGRPALLLSLCP